MPKVPITEEERQSPYYKYYARELVPAPAERYQLIENNPLTPETALKAQDLNDLFRDGYLPGEFGYTRMADGTLTLANLTSMPGVTVEMFDWWFAWHGLEPMRYKMWDPEDHYSCLTRHPHRARDARLSLKERYWDTIHDVREDIGSGRTQKIVIHFRNPADVGFDPAKLATFAGTIVCAGDEHTAAIMCHFVRPTDDGCELRTRFWFGYRVKDGRPQKVKFPPPRLIPTKVVKDLLRHNVKEFTNLAAILPEVYAEFKDSF
jgi:hypothetical protein